MTEERAERGKNGQFLVGHKRLGKGRKGIPNKVPGDIRAWITAAAERLGADGAGLGGGEGFIMRCAQEYPPALLAALLKIMPPPTEPVAEPTAPRAVTIVSVPEGHYFHPDKSGRLFPAYMLSAPGLALLARLDEDLAKLTAEATSAPASEPEPASDPKVVPLHPREAPETAA